MDEALLQSQQEKHAMLMEHVERLERESQTVSLYMRFLVIFNEDCLPDSTHFKIIVKLVNPVNRTLLVSLRHLHDMPNIYNMIPDITRKLCIVSPRVDVT